MSVVLAIAFCVVTGSRPAIAGAPSADQARFEQGIRAMEKGDFAAAAAAFGDAYAATKNTKYLWNLALAEIKSNRPFEALQHLRMYVKRPDASAQNLERANPLIERVRHDVGSLTVDAPSGAEVLVDGASLGKAPLTSPVDVDPNIAHVVEAYSGARSARTNVPPPGLTPTEVKLAFPESPTAASPVPAAAPGPAPSVSTPTPGGVPYEGTLITLVIAETVVGAACGAIGYATFRNGQREGDDTKEVVGGSLMGAGVLFLGALAPTLLLWPQSSQRSAAWVSPTLSPSGGGVSFRGVF